MSLHVSGWAALALIVVQGADAALHLATNQVEPVRLVSNVVLVAWAVISLLRAGDRAIGVGSLAAYIGLNGWFLFQNGLTNPDTGDSLRIPLFVLLGLSIALTLTTLTRRTSRGQTS